MNNTPPPPPPGYVLQGASQGTPPPPPPGYEVVHPTGPDVVVTPQAQEEPSLLSQLGRQFVMAGRNVAHGAMEIPGMINDPIVNTLNYAEGKLGVDPKYRFGTAAQATDALLNAAHVPDYQPQNGTERVVGRIEQGLGSMAGGMGVGSALSGTGNAAAKVVGDALASHPVAQTTATTTGSALGGIAHEEGAPPVAEAAATLLGSASPVGFELGAAAASKTGARLLGRADTETAALAQLAEQHGIPLKASQVASSKVGKLVDSGTGQVPFSGAGKFQDVQQEAFNRAVGRTIGVDAPKLTPEVFNGAVKRLNGEFERLTGNNAIPVTPDLQAKLQAVADDAAAYFGPESESMVKANVDRLMRQAQNGQIPGKVFQSVDSKLGQAIRAGGERSVALGDLQEVLRDAMEANIAPADADAWALARQQWRDMRTIEPLVAKSETGDIAPAQLMGRVTANGAGKTAMARGSRGDLGDLARIGQRFLKNVVPDSGTARRLALFDTLRGVGGAAAGGALGATAVVNPWAALAAAAPVAISPSLQSALRNPRLVQAVLRQPAQPGTLTAAMEASLNPSLQSIESQRQ